MEQLEQNIELWNKAIEPRSPETGQNEHKAGFFFVYRFHLKFKAHYSNIPIRGFKLQVKLVYHITVFFF